MCQSSVEWNKFRHVSSSTERNSLIFVYHVTFHFIQSPFLLVKIPQQLALQSEFLMLRTFFFSLWMIVRSSSWHIGHVNFSRQAGDLRSNLVASSKILATRMVATWRVEWPHGSSGPGSSPGWGLWLCCVLGDDTVHSCMNGYRRI